MWDRRVHDFNAEDGMNLSACGAPIQFVSGICVFGFVNVQVVKEQPPTKPDPTVRKPLFQGVITPIGTVPALLVTNARRYFHNHMIFFVSVLFYSLAVARPDFDEVRNRVLGIGNNIDVGIHFCGVSSVAITGFNPALLNFDNVARNCSSCHH